MIVFVYETFAKRLQATGLNTQGLDYQRKCLQNPGPPGKWSHDQTGEPDIAEQDAYSGAAVDAEGEAPAGLTGICWWIITHNRGVGFINLRL